MMYWIVFLGLILSTDIGYCFYDVLNSGPSEQFVSSGSQATITFITDSNTSVVWTHMSTNSSVATSVNGSFTMYGDTTYYQGVVNDRTVNGSLMNAYILRVVVDFRTVGIYRCSYSSPGDDSGNAYFTVGMNSAVSSPISLRRTDFTTCCNSSGVTNDCQPACNAANLHSTFNYSRCASTTNLNGLHKCGAGGRNHVLCCQRRGVTGACIEMCAKPDVHNVNSTCANQLQAVILCFFEGQVIIPSSPRNVIVETTSRTSVTVYWNIPLENSGYLDGYQVFYKPTDASSFKSKHVNRTSLNLKLTDLEINKKYAIYVQATGRYGSSFPSTTVFVSTVEEYFYKHNGNRTVDDCCQTNGVSKACREQLCAGIPRKVTVQQVFSCLKEWPRIVKCFAGGRNHTSCCKANDVQARCLKYCYGKEVDTSYTDFICMTGFRKISSCFDAGVKTIPSPPRKLRTLFILTTSVVLKWEEPLEFGGDKGSIKYGIIYRNISAGGLESYTYVTTSLIATLSKLTIGASYDISVVAFNKHGSSLPTPVIRVITHNVHPITVDRQRPYNPLHCCKASGIDSKCQHVCDMTRTILAVPDTCQSYASKIAHCLADGRNHTGCCKRDYRINSNCYPMCSLEMGSTVPASIIWGCLRTSSFSGLRTCYQFGHKNLPSPPRNFRLTVLSDSFVKVAWDIPSKRPNLKGYRVQLLFSNGSKSYPIKGLLHKPSLGNLKPNTEYTAQVFAISADGYESLPSNSIGFRTIPKLYSEWHKHGNRHFDRYNISTCCAKSSVKVSCQPLCDTSNETTLLWTAEKATSCITEMKKILPCASGGSDHTECCQMRRVPEFCLSMCRGSVDQKVVSSAVCVQFFPEIRSCFLEGYETLPTPPILEEARTLTQNTVKIKFSKPDRNGLLSNVIYFVYYRSYGGKSKPYWSVRRNITSPFILDRLATFTTYSIFLVAASENGTSLPSALFNVTTFSNSPFSVYITADPSLNPKINDNVTLTCYAPPQLLPTYIWYHEAVVVSRDRVYNKKVTQKDSGKYVCYASAVNKTVARHVSLSVQSLMTVTTPQNMIRANLYANVIIECTFTGFPKEVKWYYSANASETMVDVTESKSLIINTTTSRLYTVSAIHLVFITSKMYGHYKCEGSNAVSKVSESVFLADPSFSGPVPTLSPPGKYKNSTECCSKLQVSANCIQGCNFNVSTDFFQRNGRCVVEFVSMQQCLTDGRNHTRCCQKANVPRHCWPICYGSMPKLESKMFDCYQPGAVKAIFRCMEEATQLVPTEPQALKVTSRTKSSISLSWRAPSEKGVAAIQYEISYNDLDMKTGKQFVTVGNQLSYTIYNLQEGHTYQLAVRAKNIHGSSSYCPSKKAATVGPPPSPTNIHAEVIAGTRVKLSWQKAPFSEAEVTVYKVFWQKQGISKPIVNDTTKLEMVFNCLEPDATYHFQVVAGNSLGMSGRSREEKVQTSTNKDPYCTRFTKKVTKYKRDTRGLTAVAILLMFLIFGLGAAGLFIYMNRNNPRYAWPGWLRRIPGMGSPGRRVPTEEFNNPVRFSNLNDPVAEEEDSNRLAFGGPTGYTGYDTLNSEV